MQAELQFLWAAVLAYVLAGVVSIFATVLRKRPERSVLGLLWCAVALHTLALGLRWERLGHGPFVSMFEILSSGVWSMALIFAVFSSFVKAIRPVAPVVITVLFMMIGWLLTVNRGDTGLPPTYRTVWLFVHIGFGKIFYGTALIAFGLAGVILLRGTEAGRRWFAGLPPDERLDQLAYRFLALGLIFETLMLIAGAIWAQNAWGRYWSWDPLETWALLTWLTLVFTLHARFTLLARRPQATLHVNALLIVLVFGLAFATFFGIPFVSVAPHKGAV